MWSLILARKVAWCPANSVGKTIWHLTDLKRSFVCPCCWKLTAPKHMLQDGDLEPHRTYLHLSYPVPPTPIHLSYPVLPYYSIVPTLPHPTLPYDTHHPPPYALHPYSPACPIIPDPLSSSASGASSPDGRQWKGCSGSELRVESRENSYQHGIPGLQSSGPNISCYCHCCCWC